METTTYLIASALLVAVQALPAADVPTMFGPVHYTNLNNINVVEAESRILGGTLATSGQFPFQVGFTTGNSTVSPEGFCGGMLISPTVVLTAAHCIYEYTQFEVILGTLRALDPNSANRVTIRTSQKVVHENFNFSYGLNNDIGLLILPVPVIMSSTINTILLPRRRDTSETFVGRVATTSGWGKVDDGPGFINDNLLYVNVDVVNNAECEYAYGPNYVPPTKMCISTAGGTKGPCNGDSGGPMFLDNAGERIAIGIVSFGATAGCESGFPDVYTRITSFLTWIEANGGPAVRP